jgi:hypothetical protein
MPTRQNSAFSRSNRHPIILWLLTIPFACALFQEAFASYNPKPIPLSLAPGDVIATGKEWIALPTIRASDGALVNFSVLSMRDRGLLQVAGDRDTPVLEPYFRVDGNRLPFQNPSWELIEYSIPPQPLWTMTGAPSPRRRNMCHTRFARHFAKIPRNKTGLQLFAAINSSRELRSLKP